MSGESVDPQAPKEISEPTKKLGEDLTRIKEVVLAFGALVGLYATGINALEKPASSFFALSLALLSLAGLSWYLGGTGFPKYATWTKAFLWLGALCLCVVVGILIYRYFAAPGLIAHFEINATRIKRPVVQVPGKEKQMSLHMAINKATREELPAMAKNGTASLMVIIAKEDDAVEIVIQKFTLIMRDYKAVPPGQWLREERRLTYPKAIDYRASLAPELKAIDADNDNPTNPQITDKFSVPIHLHLDATKPGVYTFVCKVEVSCLKRKESKETNPFTILVLDEEPIIVIPEKKPLPKGEELKKPKGAF